MESETGARYTDGVLYKYEKRIFDELTKNGELLKKLG